jgi:hypothetical protein
LSCTLLTDFSVVYESEGARGIDVRERGVVGLVMSVGVGVAVLMPLQHPGLLSLRCLYLQDCASCPGTDYVVMNSLLRITFLKYLVVFEIPNEVICSNGFQVQRSSIRVIE